MIIEQSTNYAYKLKYMDNPTFDKVRDLSTKFYRELPQALQNELFEALNRGIDILDSEPQMTAYLFAFGKMHQAKLDYAFGKLPEEFLEQPEINIIDYGCGQTIGTMCFADFLMKNGHSQRVKSITLIEPSEICLKRAALHASRFFFDAEIKMVNKKFDDLTKDDILCSEEIPTLHILSNVLDMLCFDLNKYSNLIKSNLKGCNQFVCVGPLFNYSDKDNRMEEFCSLLNGNVFYNKSFDKYEFDEQKAWTAHILCFGFRKTINNDFSTEVTKTDIDNGVEDEHGVLYSIDGKRLLQCSNYRIESYSIKKGTKVICDFAFGDFFEYSCESLREIVIPDTVTRIGFGAFIECNSLQQITIPNSVVEIGDEAFWRCKALHQVYLPNSVSNIGEDAFADCRSLQQIIIPHGSSEKFKKILDKGLWDKIVEPSNIESNRLSNELESLSTTFTNNAIENGIEDEFGLIFSKDGKKLLKCNNLKLVDYSIPDSVRSIGSVAFSNCSLLRKIIIPVSVTSIGGGAFRGCSSLQQIIIPDSVTHIGGGAFIGCKSLQQIIIPNSITSIETGVFGSCSSLQQITIPDSVKSIGFGAFAGCKSLQQVIIPMGCSEKFKKMLDEGLWDKLYEVETI